MRPLVFSVKMWAKHEGINDASQSTLSSYALTLLMLFYLVISLLISAFMNVYNNAMKLKER